MPILSQRSNNNKKNNMVQCKKHPKHKQSPGVCSLCLAEKLSKVSSSTRMNNSRALRAREYYCSSSSSISSSEDESSYASSTVSPPIHEEEGRHMRIVSDVNLSDIKYLSNTFGNKGEDNNNHNTKKGLGGFWSKFIRPKRNNHHLNNIDVNNKGYMSQPLLVASSSGMVVC